MNNWLPPSGSIDPNATFRLTSAFAPNAKQILFGLIKGRFMLIPHCLASSIPWSSVLLGSLRGRLVAQCFGPILRVRPEVVTVEEVWPLSGMSEGGSVKHGDGCSRSGLSWLKLSFASAVVGEVKVKWWFVVALEKPRVARWLDSSFTRSQFPVRSFVETDSPWMILVSTDTLAWSCFSYSSSWPRKLKLGDMVGLLSLTYLVKKSSHEKLVKFQLNYLISKLLKHHCNSACGTESIYSKWNQLAMLQLCSQGWNQMKLDT